MNEVEPSSSLELHRVFEPVTVGDVALRNRIFVPAHTTNFASSSSMGSIGIPYGRYLRYYEERARGGAGLLITEADRRLNDTRSALPTISKEMVGSLMRGIHQMLWPPARTRINVKEGANTAGSPARQLPH